MLWNSTRERIHRKFSIAKSNFYRSIIILKINNISRLLTYRWICNRFCCFVTFAPLESLFQSTETAQCLPFNLSIHRIESKRTDNRNLFSHNWKNFAKNFKQRATNFLAPFQRLEDTLNKHVTLNKASPHYLLKVPPLFSLWQELRNNVQNLENLAKLKKLVWLFE